MRGFIGLGLLLGALLSTACAESVEEPVTPATTRVIYVPVAEPIGEDNFWAMRQASQRRDPGPSRPRSISLGFGAEGRLPITRDSPEREWQRKGSGQTWWEYINEPSWDARRPSSESRRQYGAPSEGPRRHCRCSYED
jgi:hypothetical protein